LFADAVLNVVEEEVRDEISAFSLGDKRKEIRGVINKFL